MIKLTKSLSLIMIILSIVFCITGIWCSKLAVMNRGKEFSSGSIVNGGIVTNYTGVMGGNEKAEETAKFVSVLSYILSGVFLFAGIGMAVNAKKKNNVKTIKKHGIILEKQSGTYESVIVEFDDNSRKKLLVEPPIIVANGDKGIIGFKENLLVEFIKD